MEPTQQHFQKAKDLCTFLLREVLATKAGRIERCQMQRFVAHALAEAEEIGSYLAELKTIEQAREKPELCSKCFGLE